MTIRKAIVALFVALGLIAAPTANAADAYIGGLFGSVPQMSTITGPAGETCGSDCTRIKYDNVSTQSAEKATSAWLSTHGAGDVLFAYSEGATGAEDALLANPQYAGTVIFLGSPGVPGNGNATIEGGRPTPTTTNATVTFVTVNGDSVAQPGTPGATLSTHINGYNNLDARNPKTSVVLTPNVTANTYDKPVPPCKIFCGKTSAATPRAAAVLASRQHPFARIRTHRPRA